MKLSLILVATIFSMGFVTPQSFAAPLVTQQLPPTQLPGNQPPPAPFPNNQLPTPRASLEEITTPLSDDELDSGQLVRIKDITTVAGERTHLLEGLGLVDGLGGTGGKALLTSQMLNTFLQRRRIQFQPLQQSTRNSATVRIQALVPAFQEPGETFTATVSVADDASSLLNGSLVATPLYGYDNQIYAMAFGHVTVGGYSAGGAAANVQKNHVNAGTAKAQLEVPLCTDDAFQGNSYRLLLRNKDPATAVRIANEINVMVPGAARAINSGTVIVSIPPRFQQSRLDFVVLVNSLRIRPDMRARIVVNQKTGTIVIGRNVKLSRVAFASANLLISTSELPIASQPAPFSEGQTVVLPRTQVTATEQSSRFTTLNEAPTVGDLAAALNVLGVTPHDLIPILQEMRTQGSLQAELIIQ